MSSFRESQIDYIAESLASNDINTLGQLSEIGIGFSDEELAEIKPCTLANNITRTARNKVGNIYTSDSQCLKGVREVMYEYGTIGWEWNRHAYQMEDVLDKNDNFVKVECKPEDLDKLPAGSVVIWKKGNTPSGHISIASGDGRELSDFNGVQRTSCSRKDGKKYGEPVVYMLKDNQVDNDTIRDKLSQLSDKELQKFNLYAQNLGTGTQDYESMTSNDFLLADTVIPYDNNKEVVQGNNDSQESVSIWSKMNNWMNDVLDKFNPDNNGDLIADNSTANNASTRPVRAASMPTISTEVAAAINNNAEVAVDENLEKTVKNRLARFNDRRYSDEITTGLSNNMGENATKLITACAQAPYIMQDVLKLDLEEGKKLTTFSMIDYVAKNGLTEEQTLKFNHLIDSNFKGETLSMASLNNYKAIDVDLSKNLSEGVGNNQLLAGEMKSSSKSSFAFLRLAENFFAGNNEQEALPVENIAESTNNNSNTSQLDTQFIINKALSDRQNA